MVVAMRNFKIWVLCSSLLVGSVACQGDPEDETGDRVASEARPRTPPRLIQQIAPPIDLKEPPADAAKTASGLSYKKMTAHESGAQAKATDTALVHYTGWRQRSGETFFSTKGRGQPIAISVSHAVPGFGEALQLLHKGEKAVLWVPASEHAPEPVVYEIEVVDILPSATLANRAPPAEKSEAATATLANRAPPTQKSGPATAARANQAPPAGKSEPARAAPGKP
jgi:FKBP-type peptidyl-prolyl cis-trans isomerase